MVAVRMKQVVCPYCNSTYRIPESKIPAKGATAICKKCGNRILIEGLQKSAPAVASEPSAIQKESPTPRSEGLGLPSDPALLEDYPDLQVLASPQLDYGEIFKPKKNGRYKSGLNKYKLKVLNSIQGILAKVLNEEERVMRIGSGTAYYPAELFLGNGYLTMMYNCYAIIGTNQRALLINIDNRKKRPTHYLFQLPYHNLKKVALSSLFGRLTFKMMKGKKRILMGIKRAAARELYLFFKESKRKLSDAKHTPIIQDTDEYVDKSMAISRKQNREKKDRQDAREGKAGCTPHASPRDHQEMEDYGMPWAEAGYRLGDFPLGSFKEYPSKKN